MKTLYCIRHGTSLHNKLFHEIGRRAYKEYRDTSLLQEGIMEAEKLNTNWDAIDEIELVIVSPLSRTIETALQVFKNKNVPIISIDCILEHPQSEDICNMRLNKIKLIEKYPLIDFSLLSENNKLYWHEKYEESQEIKQLNSRIHEFKCFIHTRHENNIAVVSHSSFLSQFMFGKTGDESCELKHCHPYKVNI